MVAAVAAGEVELLDVERDGVPGTVRVVRLAEAVPGVGKVQARRVLDALGILETTPWADVSDDQAASLAGALKAAADGRSAAGQ